MRYTGNRRRRSQLIPLAAAALVWVAGGASTPLRGADQGGAGSGQSQTTVTDAAGRVHTRTKAITQAEREAAADRLKAKGAAAGAPTRVTALGTAATPGAVKAAAEVTPVAMTTSQLLVGPNGQLIPDYSGVTPNYANSPVPDKTACSPPNFCGIRKFVDGLPGVGAGAANNLGQYIPVATPDTTSYPGADYYEIELGQYAEKMHTDLPPTTLRGYRQANMGGTPFHYLGPLIAAQRGRPVRITFMNKLKPGEEGDLFLPVDTTLMGAGAGPNLSDDVRASLSGQQCLDAIKAHCYTQNRATLHLNGGVTPWISDGSSHQWITPAGEATPYPNGVSVYNVPDMPNPGAPGSATNPVGTGSQTFYYTNDQSARLMFYHDRTLGITRLNVYAGQAAPYLLTDAVEQDLVARGLIPADQIPVIIQDKTFVDPRTIRVQDPTWNWGTGPIKNSRHPTLPMRTPVAGDLWWPHVFMAAQNPYDISGANAMGRWGYGPWFWPPTTGIPYGPVANPYFDTTTMPWQPDDIPGTPNPSWVGEAFLDTPVVNGTAYPTITLEPKAYRFRILDAAHDRHFNLQLYVADPTITPGNSGYLKEVKMVPAIPNTPGFPENWPTDARDGGVPDPNPSLQGPPFIQIGTEGGFLPKPVVVENQPIAWNLDFTTFNVGNVTDHGLLLGPAERADVILDFSAYAGKTLILYNDAPAPFPALDPRYDYYTGNKDLRKTGGAATTLPGFGPNTRTIMQIRVAGTPGTPFDLAALQAEFKSTSNHVDGRPGVFQRAQNPIIVAQRAYNETYDKSFPNTFPYWGVVRIQDFAMSFKTTDDSNVTLTLGTKSLHDEAGAVFDNYGRTAPRLGLELPYTGQNQSFVMSGFADPPTELVKLSSAAVPIGAAEDGTQIWKLTHNGVDTHPINFHLFDVQLINRVGWDGAIRLPGETELGWKNTIRLSPLEDTIVALRPTAPRPESLPFALPNSVRPLNPVLPVGSTFGFTNVNPQGQAVTVVNDYVNFGWEYAWRGHTLSHEDNDMKRPLVIAVAPTAPSGLVASRTSDTKVLLTWTSTSANATGFRVERAIDAGFTTQLAPIGTASANSFSDNTLITGQSYFYRVFALNIVGSTAVETGYPSLELVSGPSNTAPAPAQGVPAVTISPAALTFSTPLNIQSDAQVATVTNTGTAPLSITNVTRTGSHPSQFAHANGCLVGPLAPGASCTVSVRFLPTTASPLTKTATLNVLVAAPATNATVALTGKIIVPTFTMSASSLTFGRQTVNTVSTPPKVLTLKNTGTLPLVITNVTRSQKPANQFGHTTTCGPFPATLPAGSGCTISVDFRPTSSGEKEALLNVLVAAPASNKSVKLKGTGR